MQKQGMLAQVGTYCLNKGCNHYNRVNAGNVVRYGKDKQGRQRYQCKLCKKVFNERFGTLFYGKRTAVRETGTVDNSRGAFALIEPVSGLTPV